MIVLGLGGLLIAILVLISAGPGGALIITLLAAVSFPVLILICFWLDRYEPEPGRYRLAALGWGAVVAVGFSLVTEQVLFAVPDTSDFIDTAVTAPVLEELGKGLFLVAIVIFRRDQVHGILDGIVYAALVGIGFAFVEDIFYYLGSLNSDLVSVFLVRGIMGPFAHPLFTSATGIGIGIAVTTTRPAVRIFAPIARIPARGRDARDLERQPVLGWPRVLHRLRGDHPPAAHGDLGPRDLGPLPARASSSRPPSRTSRGWAGSDPRRLAGSPGCRTGCRRARTPNDWAASRPNEPLRAYQQTLIEVAFLHHRALQGTPPRDVNQRMTALLQRAAALRPYVILPPPPTALRLSPDAALTRCCAPCPPAVR